MAKLAATPRIARIYKAERASLGRVIRGDMITEEEAVEERRAGRDIVVCDGSKDDNSSLACRIEAAVGPWIRQTPHLKAGPYVLPHYQQHTPPPEGHSFYETDNRKAARRS